MSDKLIDQPTGKPTRKQLYSAVVGVIAYVLTAAAGHVWGPNLPDEIAMVIPLAAGWFAGYVVRDRDQEEDADDAE